MQAARWVQACKCNAVYANDVRIGGFKDLGVLALCGYPQGACSWSKAGLVSVINAALAESGCYNRPPLHLFSVHLLR